MATSGHATVLVVGDGPGQESLRHLTGVRPVAVLAEHRTSVPAEWEYLGRVEDYPQLLRRGMVSEVALCLDRTTVHRMADYVALAAEAGVRVWLPRAATDDLPDLERSRLARFAKRSIDIVGAVVGLALFAPVLLVAAIAIAVTDGFPVLFIQPRAGRHGRAFRIVKFRTMQKDADRMRASLRMDNEIAGGAAFKLSNDPRVSRLGMMLRKLSIDELPQLWNVLRGEMSLVGPRPHPFDDVAGYDAWQYRRLSVKPGVTGLWQVELRGDPDFANWVRKDLEYIENWSIWRDLELIIRTIPAIIRGTGR